MCDENCEATTKEEGGSVAMMRLCCAMFAVTLWKQVWRRPGSDQTLAADGEETR